MKKTGILHPALCHALASLGHTDGLVICDAGLPVPDGPERIDLALRPGIPAFLDVLEAIAAELQIERALIAEELPDKSAGLYAAFGRTLASAGAAQGAEIAVSAVPHEEFKRATRSARFLVRTGECTPFANVILYSGVPF